MTHKTLLIIFFIALPIAFLLVFFGCEKLAYPNELKTIELYPEVLDRPTYIDKDGKIFFVDTPIENLREFGCRRATREEIINFWAEVDKKSPPKRRWE